MTPPRGIKVGALQPDWEDPTFPAAPPLPRQIKAAQDDAAAKRAHSIAAAIEQDDMREVMERLIATVIRTREAEDEEEANVPCG